MTYLDRAIKDGYAIITGPENKQKIIYVTSDNHTENYNDPEEKVRGKTGVVIALTSKAIPAEIRYSNSS